MWHVNTEVDYPCPRIDDENGRGVAHVIQRDPHPVHEQGVTPEEAMRRARLMAAAPELLAFAQEWLARQGSDENYMTAKARAAIARATGEQP